MAVAFPGTRAGRSADRRDRCRSRLKALLPVFIAIPLQAAPLPEIVVVASQFRETELADLPLSITVLDADVIRAASLQHFEELIPLVPNLNWSGEGSRARYIQIRGTGELEQYQGAPNPSVGFLIDDIDLSGLGGVATSFDVDRIEVLRGPQGTRYGANALAGLIYVETGQPTATPMAALTATVGDDDTRAIGGIASGPVAGLGDELTYRLAIHQYQSSGFRNNAYLGRDDTSGQDELTARAKLRWQPRSDITLQLTAIHVDLDNGYDDFALDNSYTTQSDKPGEDSQTTDAAALRGTFGIGGVADLVSITTVAGSASVYGFDADWGNDPDYDFTQRIARQRDTVTQEFRLVSRPGSEALGADWVVGLYGLNLQEDVDQFDTANCPAAICGDDLFYATPSSSTYDATNVAAYVELGWALGPATRLAVGLRREVREADYSNSADDQADPVDRMWGGDVTLTHTLAATPVAATSLWARVARGYKAGGFNPSVFVLVDTVPEAADRLQFKPESLLNYEVGARTASPDGRWQASLSAFLQERNDQQVKIPQQFRPNDPATFLFFTENAERGSARGLELEAGWQARERLTLGAAVGLLDTKIEEFSGEPLLEGRELAHAPGYTFALNSTWRAAAGWFVRADYTGRGSFAIDYCQVDACASADPETDPYQVLDLRAGREWGAWSVEAWCRNVLDEQYAVRGFYFGNEPPDFVPTLYTRLGDPRQAGLTVNYAW
ncbi:MAG: TonB-dependent receptor [Gammaproteobacteria bacterium]